MPIPSANAIRERLLEIANGDPAKEAMSQSVLQETQLIRNGFFCGRRYSLGSFSAVWFAEENTIKYYADEDSLVSTSMFHETPTENALAERLSNDRKAA